jgi:hypothetical protein
MQRCLIEKSINQCDFVNFIKKVQYVLSDLFFFTECAILVLCGYNSNHKPGVGVEFGMRQQ